MSSSTLAQRARTFVALAFLCAVAAARAAAPDPEKSDPAAASPAAADPGKSAAPPAPASAAAGAGESTASPDAKASANRFVRDNVVIDFSVVSSTQPVREGDTVEVRFKLTDATTGEPVRAAPPAAWLDIGEPGAAPDRKTCVEKIALFMRGLVGIRPLVDLNAYYLLVLNQDASITVIDPIVGMTGKTSLFATILLPRPGADWAKTHEDKRILVSIPETGHLVVIDGETFKIVARVAAGQAPTRVALQRDPRSTWKGGRFVWVGNDAKDPAQSGVTVVDVESLKPVGSIATGAGHHEIAFSSDVKTAFVTNRAGGTVSVVDAERLAKVKDVKTGPEPISIATSSLSRSTYVADGKSGEIAVLDGRGEIVKRIAAKPGLGPMEFSPDGRWGFVVNPHARAVHVVDAADNRLAHTVALQGKPFQVVFTERYAYLRLLDSERVSMVALESLGTAGEPRVHEFPAGSRAPELVRDLSIADTIVSSAAEAGVFVASPADNSTYYYMEGMNFPMGSYGAYGHAVRAVTLVDRSLKETEPGVYAATVRLPASGRYDVAFMMQAPMLSHCFAMTAEPNAELRAAGPVELEFVSAPLAVSDGEPAPFRVRLREPVTGKPKTGLDLRVTSYRLPADPRREGRAREVEPGVYEAIPALAGPGVYYVYFSVPELGVSEFKLPYRSVRVKEKPQAAAGDASKGKP